MVELKQGIQAILHFSWLDESAPAFACCLLLSICRIQLSPEKKKQFLAEIIFNFLEIQKI